MNSRGKDNMQASVIFSPLWNRYAKVWELLHALSSWVVHAYFISNGYLDLAHAPKYFSSVEFDVQV